MFRSKTVTSEMVTMRSTLGRFVHRQRENLLFTLRDTADTVLRRRPPMVPPRRLLFDGPRDPQIFLDNGQEFLSYYRDLCQLGPDEAVLDIGSGIGRKTVPLTGYLSPQGSYLGLDVSRKGIAWCTDQISRRFPNFRFRHIDVFNRRYHPAGSIEPENFRLPVESASVDFVVLASVFTHMFPPGVAQYLREIGRVLRPGTGRCLISFFLLDEASEQAIAAEQGDYRFAHRHGQYAIEDPQRPEDAVAFDATTVRDLYAAAGLEVSAV
ncbi:MAG: class I SAM-dependent methyltransferase, partial [Acidobacteriota bacterium]